MHDHLPGGSCAHQQQRDEEITALRAIYQDDINVTAHPQQGQVQLHVQLQTHPVQNRNPLVTLTLLLPKNYPQTPPQVVQLNHQSYQKILPTVARAAAECAGQVCLLQLIQLTQETLLQETVPESQPRLQEDTTFTDQEACIRIDHMRQCSHYLKLLQKWCSQLGLSGRVFYRNASGRPIVGKGRLVMWRDVYVLVRGETCAIGEFVKRLRTEYVDVDSRGQRCRERQSSLLWRRVCVDDGAWSGKSWDVGEYDGAPPVFPNL